MLTDKAKIEFEKWTLENYETESGLRMSSVYMYALIIDWFDSIGIYITIIATFNQYSLYIEDKKSNLTSREVRDIFFKSRPEATNKAIEKANEIYNI